MACGQKEEHLKNFIIEKLDRFSEEEKRLYAKTFEIGDSKTIGKAARYAEEFIARQKSPRIMEKGMVAKEER